MSKTYTYKTSILYCIENNMNNPNLDFFGQTLKFYFSDKIINSEVEYHKFLLNS